MIKHIHPFPARMAPELAIAALEKVQPKSVILDPMVGSGMVVRHASELGHDAIGFDTDPLAVLISRVWTTPTDLNLVSELMRDVLKCIENCSNEISLPWIDLETEQFIDFWFAEPQRSSLSRVANCLQNLGPSQQNEADVLRVALSRIIITKSHGASLARDVSHSRPHKVAESSTFDVIKAFEGSVKQITNLLTNAPPPGNAKIEQGDARDLIKIERGQVDVVLTSPPYLNAIDYLRGHRLSLVWLGHTISSLRTIRSNNIGAERGLDRSKESLGSIIESMGRIDELPPRYVGMIARYAVDIYDLMSEVARVLKVGGRSIFVVGNSCLNGVFIRNSDAIIKAASMLGFTLESQIERELPVQSRYLPMPKETKSALGKRMRTETILTLVNV